MRATHLSEVVEAELLHLQFPSLRTRTSADASITELRQAAAAIHEFETDEISRAACAKANFLSCSVNKGCGFGCQAHHLVFCLVMAYGSGRTLRVDTSMWAYAQKGWESTAMCVCVLGGGGEYVGTSPGRSRFMRVVLAHDARRADQPTSAR